MPLRITKMFNFTTSILRPFFSSTSLRRFYSLPNRRPARLPSIRPSSFSSQRSLMTSRRAKYPNNVSPSLPNSTTHCLTRRNISNNINSNIITRSTKLNNNNNITVTTTHTLSPSPSFAHRLLPTQLHSVRKLHSHTIGHGYGQTGHLLPSHHTGHLTSLTPITSFGLHREFNNHHQSLFNYSSQPAMSNTDDSSHGQVILQREARRPPKLLSLREIYEFSQPGNLDDFAIFLWRELPTRIAHRAIELQNLPYGLSNTKSISKVRGLYTHSFHLFRLLAKPVTLEAKQAFVREISEHYARLRVSTELLAAGIAECILETPSQALTIQTCPFLNGFLDRFHAARIGTRLLTGQFIELHKREQAALRAKNKDNNNNNNNNNKNNRIQHITKATKLGLIDSECRVRSVLEMAQDDAARLCYGNFGKCPEVYVEDESNVIFAYVTSDLHYILFELMKNSMRAICEYHSDLDEDDLPGINVVIVNSQEDREVKIKISDEGGGIPMEDMKKIFLYSFTTVNAKRPKHRRVKKRKSTDGADGVNSSIDSGKNGMNTVPRISIDTEDDLSKFSNVKQMASAVSNDIDVIPMAGFGYGLPLSRLYARYFGGDLQVMSMDGHGTDAYLTLKYLNLQDEYNPDEDMAYGALGQGLAKTGGGY